MRFNIKILPLLLMPAILFSLTIKDARAFEEMIVAIVNDEAITMSEMAGSSVFPFKSLSFLIEKKLQLQIAKKGGISVQPAEVSDALNDIKRMNSFKSDDEMKDALLKEGYSLEEYKSEVTEQITLLKLLNREIKSKISVRDKELEDYYLSHQGSFLLPESIRIGYIYIPLKGSDTPDIVEAARNSINIILSNLKHNLSFAEIKNRHLEFPQVHFIEDLGYIKRGDLMPELENIAFSLTAGEISEVISTPSGFYIINLIDRKKIEYKSFEEVKEIIREAVFQEKSERLYKEWLYNLKSSSYINIVI